MNLNKLTFSQFQQIQKNHYSLDIIYLLLQADKELDLKKLCESSIKTRALHQTLLRKGLITYEGNITLAGKELIDFVTSETAEEIKKVKKDPEDFNTWWKTYPGTDTFVFQGREFTGTRSLRVKKEDCRTKFEKIIAEGQYTVADLIAALEIEVLQKKNASIKDKTNKMSFMQNSLTYLNQRTFEPFVELHRAGISRTEQTITTGGTDI